jgi:hypothetical protein
MEAEYKAPDCQKTFTSTGKLVLPLQTDRDAPQQPSDSSLGRLRRDIMEIQQNINVFLTSRMKDSKEQEEEIEKEILDGDEGTGEED